MGNGNDPEIFSRLQKDPLAKLQLLATLQGMRDALGVSGQPRPPHAETAVAPSPVDLFEDAVCSAMISAKALATRQRLTNHPTTSFALTDHDPYPLSASGQELQVIKPETNR